MLLKIDIHKGCPNTPKLRERAPYEKEKKSFIPNSKTNIISV
jgi:hypothetical protein